MWIVADVTTTDLDSVLNWILGQVYPAAATLLWNMRALVLFLLAITLAFAVGYWLVSLRPGA